MALWTPAQLNSAVAAWFDAMEPDTVLLYGAGHPYVGRVSGWKSRVGGIVASSRPDPDAVSKWPAYFSPTKVDGKPAVYVGAGNRLEGFMTFPLTDAFAMGINPASMIAMARHETENGYVDLVGYGIFSQGNLRELYATSPTSYGSSVFYGDAGVVRPTSETPSAIVYGAFDRFGMSVVLDGTYEASFAKDNWGPEGAAEGFLMGGPNPAPTNLQETLIFNRQLTVEERQKVEGYLAWKWGQEKLLAASHPYKAAAPTTVATGVTLKAAGGIAALQGTPAQLLHGAQLIASSATCQLSGRDVTLKIKAALRVDARPATFGLGFATPQMLHGHVMTVAGQPVILGANGPLVLHRHRVIADVAPFLVGGRPIQLLHGHSLAASSKIVSIAGTPVAMVRSTRLTAEPSTFVMGSPAVALDRIGRLAIAANGTALTVTLTSPVATISRIFRFAAGGASMQLAAPSAGIRFARRITANRTGFVLTSTSTALRISGRAVILPPASRSLMAQAPSRTLTAIALPRFATARNES